MIGLFLYSKNIDFFLPSGIDKKILSQIDALNKNGLTCSLTTAIETPAMWAKILSRMPFINLNPMWKYRDEFEHADFIYIRKPPYCTGCFIRLLKKIKQNNPYICLILEIPTYPYDSEFTRIYKRYIYLLKDRINRKKYKRYIERIVTFSEHESIWGIKTIRTQNGIDLNLIPRRKIKEVQKHTALRLLTVAMFAPWHGYDRLIRGLKLYYSKPVFMKVTIDMVGEGPSLLEYKELVNELGLSNYVTFHGQLNGEKLDSIFDNADIAVASLGIHRIGLQQVSTLKAREYCARGIPFIKSYEDVDFGPGLAYVLSVEASESPIDIQTVLTFYDNLMSKYERKDIILTMRGYAEEHLGWDSKMKPVADYIKSRRKQSIYE